MTIISLDRDVPILLNLGRQGDNDAQVYAINFATLRERYGEGTLTLAVKRRTDSQPYPVALDQSGATAVWTVSATDTAVEGNGEAQFTYTVDGVVKKTVVYKTKVERSLQPISETPPEPFDNWLDELNQMGGQIATAKNDALTAIGAAQTTAEGAVEKSLTTIREAVQDASDAISTQGGQAVTDAQTAARNANQSAQAAAESETAAQGYAEQAEQYAENLHFTDDGEGNISITIGGQNG